MEKLALQGPSGDGRVEIGLAFDGIWPSKEIVVSLFKRAKSVGIKFITIHSSGKMFSSKSFSNC